MALVPSQDGLERRSPGPKDPIDAVRRPRTRPTGPRASLLGLDPELGAELSDRVRADASRRLGVGLAELETGEWAPEADVFGALGGIGLLMVEGFLVRHVVLEHRAGAELLGPGDLLRPWQNDEAHTAYPYTPGWCVITPVTVAVLDLAFTAQLAPYPQVVAALVGRALQRSRRLAEHLVLAQLASVEHRVLLVLWHLADEWGRVGRDGVMLPLPLTHAMLGRVIGARRPSVTTALGALRKRELVESVRDSGYLLRGRPPDGLPLLRGAARAAPAVHAV